MGAPSASRCPHSPVPTVVVNKIRPGVVPPGQLHTGPPIVVVVVVDVVVVVVVAIVVVVVVVVVV